MHASAGRKVMYVTGSTMLSDYSFRYALDILDSMVFHFDTRDKVITFPNNGTVKFYSAGMQLRGLRADALILDEVTTEQEKTVLSSVNALYQYDLSLDKLP